MSGAWGNWAGTEQVTPLSWVRPGSVAEVVAAVATRRRVRVVGAGHSFNDIAVSADIMLDLGAMQRVRYASTVSGLVTVEAGMPLYRLSAWLWRAGLSLSNLGDIDRQTVAGAISTGTHGTGLSFGSLSSQVRGLELVLADGSVVWCSASSRPELFAAACVGLGAFGVITAVQFQCVPAFPLASSERPVPLDAALAALVTPEHDHAEFFWFPHTPTALLKTSTRLPPGSALARRSLLSRVVDDEILENLALDVVTGVSSSLPGLIRPVNRFCTALLPTRTQVDRSYRVFASRRQAHEPFMRRLGSICASVGGRPHWGKIHYLTASSLAALYPHFDDALRVREAVDPERVFVNPHVSRVLLAD